MIYVELDEETLEMFGKFKEINFTDYELKGEWISTDNLMLAFRDAIIEYEKLQEEFEDYKNQDEYNPEIEIPEIHGKGISY